MDSGTGVDWTAIEPEWKAGIKSKAELSREFGVSRTAMDKHFGALGIERDLAPRIRAEAERKIAQDAVAARLQPYEGEVVEANAEIQAQIRRLHRKDIGHLNDLCRTMTKELLAVSGRPMDLEQLIQALEGNEDTAALAEQVQKLISLPSRVVSLERLVSAKRTLVTLEREAWGINGQKDCGLPAQIHIEF